MLVVSVPQNEVHLNLRFISPHPFRNQRFTCFQKLSSGTVTSFSLWKDFFYRQQTSRNPPVSSQTRPAGVAKHPFTYFRLSPIAMRQFCNCQHHPRTDCACARRSHSRPAVRIPGGESERRRKKWFSKPTLDIYSQHLRAVRPGPARFASGIWWVERRRMKVYLVASPSQFAILLLLITEVSLKTAARS